MNYNTQNQKTISGLPSSISDHLVVMAKKYWWTLALLAVFSLIDIGIGLMQPWPTKIFIDSVVGTVKAPGPLASYTHQTILLFIVTAISAALFISSSVSGYVQMRLSAWLNFNIDKSVQKDLFENIIGLPPDTFSEHTAGDYIYRQTTETKAAAEFIIEVSLTMFESVLRLSGAIIILLLINLKLGLIALVPIPIIILSIKYFNPIIERQARELRESASKLFTFTEESINQSRLIRVFNRIATQSAELVSLLSRNYQTGIKQKKTGFFFNFINSTSSLLQSTILLLAGGILILHGQLTIGELVIFFSYVSYLTAPLHSIAGKINQIKTLKIHLSKVYDIIDSPKIGLAQNVITNNDALAPNQVRHMPDDKAPLIAFRSVSVTRAGKTVLSDLSFDIYTNEKVGIIGPSGSGKSTLFDVILGFIPHQSGEIYLSGQPIENFNLKDVQQYFSVVSQESDLLTKTIEENIAFGAPINSRPTIQQITAAADAANATEFIIKLPNMFETMVGDATVHLSGGQKQRISIARSLLRDAPILLLDEPTSALDHRSAKEVLKALEGLMSNRTSLFITHDMSILDTMDRVYVMKDGTIKPIEAYGGLAGYEKQLAQTQKLTIGQPS